MNYFRKARGTTITGLVIGLALLGAVAPTGYRTYARERADAHLDTIIRNLTEIDIAVHQWVQDHPAGSPNRATLDGANGDGQCVAWPTGPVPGSYTLTTPANRNCRAIARNGIPLCATFDGGSKGPLNRTQWLRDCSADPSACGL